MPDEPEYDLSPLRAPYGAWYAARFEVQFWRGWNANSLMLRMLAEEELKRRRAATAGTEKPDRDGT